MESYLFDTHDECTSERKVYALIIYDITDNKRRMKLAKFLQGYGFRIQKSAFEAKISQRVFNKLIKEIPKYASSEDSIRVYKIIGNGQVFSFGAESSSGQEDVIII